ncbi:hypothetical protein D3C84_856850 [compost metagenome]
MFARRSPKATWRLRINCSAALMRSKEQLFMVTQEAVRSGFLPPTSVWLSPTFRQDLAYTPYWPDWMDNGIRQY